MNLSNAWVQGDEEENVVRGDKGRKKKTVLTTWSYLTRVMQLAKGQWHIVSMAMCFLCVSSISSVLLPNYQGAILDRVINDDKEGFYSAMSYYIAFNITQVLFGVMRQVCFSIAGKRIQYKARNVLFTSILRQDVAFFDGMTTGQVIRIDFTYIFISARLHGKRNSLTTTICWAAHCEAGAGPCTDAAAPQLGDLAVAPIGILTLRCMRAQKMSDFTMILPIF